MELNTEDVSELNAGRSSYALYVQIIPLKIHVHIFLLFDTLVQFEFRLQVKGWPCSGHSSFFHLKQTMSNLLSRFDITQRRPEEIEINIFH